MENYILGDQVCAVRDGDWLVFLDIRGNQYSAIDIDAVPQIEGVTLGRRHGIAVNGGGATLRALLSRGLICDAHGASHTKRPATRSNPMWSSAGEWMGFALSASWYAERVRRGELMRALERVRLRKIIGMRAPVRFESAALAFARYSEMRIWAPMPYVCLFNSLLLSDFLLRRGLKCDLVFGVRARPFAAHCWVEADREILDDGDEDCASFAQILRV